MIDKEVGYIRIDQFSVLTAVEFQIATGDLLLKGMKKLIIDLSIPRNVDTRVTEIEAITLIDMDSINALTGEALKKKKELIPALHAIIDEEKMDYLNKLERSKRVQPRIREIDNKLTDITKGELDRIKNKLDPDAFEMLEEVTYRIKKKILAVHINRIDEEMHAEHQNA